MSGSRAGFSLVEVILALIILTIGVLAMGASAGYVLSEVRHSGLTTERSVAVREVSEQLRATDWAALDTKCSSTTFTVGRYTVSCTTQQPEIHLKEVEVVSVGPSYVAGGAIEDVADTTALLFAEPMD